MTLNLTELASQVTDEIIVYTKDEYTGNPNVAEFGDYLPFMSYVGEKEWVRQHIERTAHTIVQRVPPTDREDTLVGLLEVYQTDGHEIALELSENYFDLFFREYVSHGQVQTPYIGRLNSALEVAQYSHSSRSVRTASRIASTLLSKFKNWNIPPYQCLPRNGVFIELLVDTYEATDNRFYLNKAYDLAQTWIRNSSFQNIGLFSTPPLFPWRPKFASIFKNNTGVVNGLLSLVRVTDQQEKRDRLLKSVRRWITAVCKHCVETIVYGEYEFDSGDQTRPELIFTFSFIDVLCYAYSIENDETYLDIAQSLADPWLEQQAETGLIPLRYGGSESHHDSMTDFSISLFRISELSGKDKYKEAGRNAIEALFRYHRFPLLADIETGEPTTDKVTPRFVSLMLKSIILLDSDSIYDDLRTFKLLRDR